MNKKQKYLGINQRIPFEVLDAAVHSYLLGLTVERAVISQQMREFTSGENRIRKATDYTVQIIKRQLRLLDFLKYALKETEYNSLNLAERKVVCLCLIGLTYPIAYDLLTALGQGFKVQTDINRKFINEKVMSIYGSNRTVDIAIDALIPMLIELNTIKREKVGIYSIGTKLFSRIHFISELIIYTDIKLSSSKSILLSDLNHRPWYSYFEFVSISELKFGHLITKKDSNIGEGYLTIK